MGLIPRSIARPTAKLRMPSAIARGLTITAFINELKSEGLSYRRTLMLSDWRSASGIEAKKDVRKFTRRDRVPKAKIADVEWERLKKKYMYRAEAFYREYATGPLVSQFVNITTDESLTGQQIIDEVFERWTGYERYGQAELVRVIPTEIYHKIEPIGSLSEQ